MATHIPTKALAVKKKEEPENLLKWGKFSFYVLHIFIYLKNKKWLILIVNKKFNIFDF